MNFEELELKQKSMSKVELDRTFEKLKHLMDQNRKVKHSLILSENGLSVGDTVLLSDGITKAIIQDYDTYRLAVKIILTNGKISKKISYIYSLRHVTKAD